MGLASLSAVAQMGTEVCIKSRSLQRLGQEGDLRIIGETFFEVVSPLYGCNKAGKREGGDALTAG